MPVVDRKLKVVIDTNVFISGLNFAGKPGDVLDMLIREEMDVYISSFILSELENILRGRFGWANENISKVLSIIEAKAIKIQPKIRLSVIKEKDSDNRILECAVEARVDYLISGDKRHLLPLKEYSGVKLLSPGKFLELFEA
ncbi:putative toxin-antitoxin system toxin component, PIN family [Candidatus Poribacteria bacterium]|nr:putative toxin-antitoxin system toxin component, PIN family [Candidatus Poribacteria bacterium]